MRIGLLCSSDWANFQWGIYKSLQSVGADVIAYKLDRHIFGYDEQCNVTTPNRINELFKDRDVVLMIHSDWELLEYLDNQIIINFATGTKYRQNSELINTKFKAPITIIALPEFQTLAPNPKYLVGAIDVDRPFKEVGSSLVLGHFPSNPSVKGTDDIIRIVRDLQRLHDFDFEISTDRVSHAENLDRVNKCDIYIELMASHQGGKPYGSFGISALEAASLGKIVLTQSINDNGIYFNSYGASMLNLYNNEQGLIKQLNGLLQYKGDYIQGQMISTKEWAIKNHSFKSTGNKLIEYLNGLQR